VGPENVSQGVPRILDGSATTIRQVEIWACFVFEISTGKFLGRPESSHQLYGSRADLWKRAIHLFKVGKESGIIR